MTTELKHQTEETSISHRVHVIPREKIPAISSIMVDGKQHNLGELRDFKKVQVLNHFIPKLAHLSMSWARLKKDEVLAAHFHPTTSMMVIAQGNGKFFGDFEQELHAGDVVIVPPNCMHGFIGGEGDLIALSIQFEESGGLYEDIDNPMVKFAEQRLTMDDLLTENRIYLDKFKHHPLFQLIDSEAKTDKQLSVIIQQLRLWLSQCQNLLLIRQATCTDHQYSQCFWQQLQDAIASNLIGHDAQPDHSSQDSILNALYTWLQHRMLTADNIEKSVITDTILSTANGFICSKIISKLNDTNAKIYHQFATLSEQATDIGVTLLRRSQQEVSYTRLAEVMQQTWSIATNTMQRIQQLAET